jgi:hypothetical protein
MQARLYELGNCPTGILVLWHRDLLSRGESHRICAEDTRGSTSIKIVRTVPDSATASRLSASLTRVTVGRVRAQGSTPRTFAPDVHPSPSACALRNGARASWPDRHGPPVAKDGRIMRPTVLRQTPSGGAVQSASSPWCRRRAHGWGRLSPNDLAAYALFWCACSRASWRRCFSRFATAWGKSCAVTIRGSAMG